jgi:hypothetical protein
MFQQVAECRVAAQRSTPAIVPRSPHVATPFRRHSWPTLSVVLATSMAIQMLLSFCHCCRDARRLCKLKSSLLMKDLATSALVLRNNKLSTHRDSH